MDSLPGQEALRGLWRRWPVPGGDAEQVLDCTSSRSPISRPCTHASSGIPRGQRRHWPGFHNLYTEGSQRNRGSTFQILSQHHTWTRAAFKLASQPSRLQIPALGPQSHIIAFIHFCIPLLPPHNARVCVSPDESSRNACAQETEGLLACYSGYLHQLPSLVNDWTSHLCAVCMSEVAWFTWDTWGVMPRSPRSTQVLHVVFVEGCFVYCC